MTECERCRRWVSTWITVDTERAPELSLVLCPACLTAVLQRIEQELEPDQGPAQQLPETLGPTHIGARPLLRDEIGHFHGGIERARESLGEAHRPIAADTPDRAVTPAGVEPVLPRAARRLGVRCSLARVVLAQVARLIE